MPTPRCACDSSPSYHPYGGRPRGARLPRYLVITPMEADPTVRPGGGALPYLPPPLLPATWGLATPCEFE
jgi:hypothetical protein